jgi:hypothetical protein
MSLNHRVIQEYIFVRLNPEGALTYRLHYKDMEAGVTPDEDARVALGWADGLPDHALLHSTSWRYRDDSIILTWFVLPDHPHRQGYTLLEPQVEIEDNLDAAHPAPPEILITNVIYHALRHMAFLEFTDEVTREALTYYPEIAKIIRETNPGIAGQFRELS